MAGIILRFSLASIIASAWSARESEKQVRVEVIIPDEIHASDLSEARFQESVSAAKSGAGGIPNRSSLALKKPRAKNHTASPSHPIEVWTMLIGLSISPSFRIPFSSYV
jgi:hypothetical protein